VYFINLANVIQIKFAIPFFEIYDNNYPEFGVPVAVRGTVSFKIQDYRRFISLHRLINFSLEDFKNQINDTVKRYVKNHVANAPTQYNISVIQIERALGEINKLVEIELKERLFDDFGVVVTGVDIGAIEIDKTSDGYSELLHITREITTVLREAETADSIERMRIDREEGQYSQRMKTKSENIGAYGLEKQAEVGIKGAEALGKMGENGVGNVNLGDNAGFNPMAMMTGIALGGVVGNNLAGTMNHALHGSLNQGNNPPPIPTATYFVAENGKAIGPFDIETLTQMAMAGRVTKDTLVWTKGMNDWAKAGTVGELNDVFSAVPPSL